jgi:hypothetical protein
MLVHDYQLHGVTYQGTVILISAVMGSSDLIKYISVHSARTMAFKRR